MPTVSTCAGPYLSTARSAVAGVAPSPVSTSSLLLPGSGSVTPSGGSTVAVLVTGRSAGVLPSGAMPVMVNVMLEPAGKTDSTVAMGPSTGFAGSVDPVGQTGPPTSFPPTSLPQVHVMSVSPLGLASANTASFAAEGPALDTVTV